MQRVGRYNTWTAGDGGVCPSVWKGQSYWCSNASSGGWAEVDFQCAAAGQLQLPVGMTINMTTKDLTNTGPDSHRDAGQRHDLSRIKSWANPEGAVVAAWHSQTWFLNFFTVKSADPGSGQMLFSKGGSQGGRNWCRCDQCGYAAGLWAGMSHNPIPLCAPSPEVSTSFAPPRAPVVRSGCGNRQQGHAHDRRLLDG